LTCRYWELEGIQAAKEGTSVIRDGAFLIAGARSGD
jgi:hypothetical protein